MSTFIGGAKHAFLSGSPWPRKSQGQLWLNPNDAVGYASIEAGPRIEYFIEEVCYGIKTATWLGKSGYAARGIVFVLIGLIILQAVFTVGAKQAQGFDGALAAMAHAPHGEILLGAVAMGLILFGVYSALCAKWNKIGTRRPA